TANYAAAAQNLNAIHWSTSIDQNNTGTLTHYGAPLVSAANTVFVPVKTAGEGFRVNVFNGTTGALRYTVPTDYILPSHDWTPVLVSSAAGCRLYYAGPGGTIYYVVNPDTSPSEPVHQAFYGLANYIANAAAFNSSVFIDTPLTADTNGNVFFGFRVEGTAPTP